MEVLFVGLGSIGTRHLRNLFQVAKEKGIEVQADALRSSMRPLAEDVEGLLRAQYVSYDQLGHYDAAFITNPTHLHAHTLAELAGKVDCFFIEKPIFEGTGYDLEQLGLGPNQKAYVAAPMRWCGTFLALKERMPDLKPYSARVICSSYLPEWRPGVDYRTVYSAHKEMGGGVTIDLIHEWDYLVDLFGAPLEMYNFKGTYSHLEIDSDDLSVYIARYPSLLAEVHLDYFGRTYRRAIELFCKEGTVTADFGAGTLTLENGEVIHCEEPVNQRYLREMDYFLDYAGKGKGESINSPAMAQKVLGLTLGEPM
ncbi:MAG TPA: gfo/Idh/MocA family oxidoreductase [Candidatus Fournierella pullicola]|uniref:Gfo/Idh/MocA family oxidoreductase n=1 Tax=Candidatus Allofournierella pullicola TaxID=2838596 RepID=A0A9D1V1X1_9FIRM|nr:gfo/Idh/MocA family oxidoreductase [Candidatus Fournierella pullicola]